VENRFAKFMRELQQLALSVARCVAC